MSAQQIETLADLHRDLQAAVQLELATIPPYLCGWWTIEDPACPVSMLIQEVVIAEMRHLAVAANTLIATGGTPELRAAMPSYPTCIRSAQEIVEIALLPYGADFLSQSLMIERPAALTGEATFLAERPPALLPEPLGMGNTYWTIGQFYGSIIAGITLLVERLGEAAVFPEGGRTSRQCTYFGTQNIAVASAATAVNLLNDVIDEGEGDDNGVCDDGVVAHYYRFDSINHGIAYVCGDQAGDPTGDPLDVPPDSGVLPMLANPKMSSYLPEESRLWQEAAAFNRLFAELLEALDAGFKGEPAKVRMAIGQMLQMREAADRLLAHDVPGHPGTVAGPTFEAPHCDPA